MQNELAARPASNVLRAGELDQWLAADAALDQAQAEAEAILGSAIAAREAERRRGYAQGREEAAFELSRALATAHATLQGALAEIEQALPEFVASVIEDMLGAFDTNALLGAALRRAFGQMRRSGNAVLRVAPDGADTAEEVLRALGLTDGIRLETDPALASGSCLFESSLGMVELGLESQLRVFRETMAERWDVRS